MGYSYLQKNSILVAICILLVLSQSVFADNQRRSVGIMEVLVSKDYTTIAIVTGAHKVYHVNCFDDCPVVYLNIDNGNIRILYSIDKSDYFDQYQIKVNSRGEIEFHHNKPFEENNIEQNFYVTYKNIGSNQAVISNRNKNEIAKMYIYVDAITIITNEGYMLGLGNFERYISFVNGMELIEFSQLYDHFFRPDLVRLKLQGKEKEYQKAINGMTYEEALKNPPPKLSFNTIDRKKVDTESFAETIVQTTKPKTTLNFNITQTDNGGVGLIRIYQEGKLMQTRGEGTINKQSANADTRFAQETLDKNQQVVQAKKLLAMNTQERPPRAKNAPSLKHTIPKVQTPNIQNKEGTHTVTLDLISGNNEICIEAFNKTNTVTSYRECVTIKAAIKKREPKIYAIVAGVNTFQSNYVNNLKYSENDAKAIKEAIKATQGKVYKEVIIKELLGQEMTKGNLLKAVKEVQQKASLEDTILFYISTHGVADETGLYFIPHNNISQDDDISFKELFQELQSIKSLNQIYIVDTCQSGEAADIVSSVYDSRASVFAKSSGVHMLLATTKGTYAFESQDPNVKHGVFTSQILDALKTRETDTNKDSYISVIELSDRLKQPSNNVEYQYPVIRNIGNDVKIEKVN